MSDWSKLVGLEQVLSGWSNFLLRRRNTSPVEMAELHRYGTQRAARLAALLASWASHQAFFALDSPPSFEQIIVRELPASNCSRLTARYSPPNEHRNCRRRGEDQHEYRGLFGDAVP
jgi:hypothetical protein